MKNLNEVKDSLINTSISIESAYDNVLTLSSSNNEASQTAMDIIQDKITEINTETNLINQEKMNASRQIEINTYYTNMYNAYSNLMKINCIAFVFIIICSILLRKNVFSQTVYTLFIVLIIVVDIYITGSKLIDFSNRSNYNWDEYQWAFDKSAAPAPPTTTTVDSSAEQDVQSCAPPETETDAEEYSKCLQLIDANFEENNLQ
jgi:hypothetical protein